MYSPLLVFLAGGPVKLELFAARQLGFPVDLKDMHIFPALSYNYSDNQGLFSLYYMYFVLYLL